MSLLYMVINRETMEVLQLGGLEVISTKQFLENPEAVIDTSPVGFGGSYSCYSKDQIKQLATNVGTNPELPYGESITAIKAKLVADYAAIKPTLKSIDFYESQLKKRMQQEPDLYKQFEPEEVVITKRVSTTTPNRSSAPKAAPTTRPAGGTTKKVWDIADELRTSNPSLSAKELRPKIIVACEEQGINSSTAGTQYSKWKNTIQWG